jgi:nanoRNase/pAp phosphatase (c-di-AMP/oligoRNAs hydrolase)
MNKRPDWQALERFIATKKRVIITTHVHPDGDAIGSEIAMAEYCRLCGCERSSESGSRRNFPLRGCEPGDPLF